MSRAAPDSRYRAFHGRGPRRRTKINVHYPEAMIKLGRAVAIEYECDKLNGGGDGTRAVYRHQFDRGAYLYMDERGRKQLYILGPKIVVTDAGIEH